MKTPSDTRSVTAVIFVLFTLALLNGIALYSRPELANAQAQMGFADTVVVAAAS